MAIHGHPGGFVTAATPTVTTSSAQGIWTLEKQLVYQAASTWPSPPPVYELWAWGANAGGRLGLGNTTNYSSPKQVGALTDWASVSIINFTGAIKADGTLWTWGANTNGRLGLGNTTTYSSPKQVGALTAWASISAGYGNSAAARKTDGTIWAWGKNNSGQLGLGNTTYYSSPKQVGALTNWKNISSGVSHTSAIKTDGTLWTWGLNANGQLGLGNITAYSSPKQVGALTNWSTVVAGGRRFNLAVKTDGTLWSWGLNSEGNLGLGNTTGYSSPKQVGALTSWASISAGYTSNAVIKTDGTLWTWGANSDGRLGLGNTTDYSSPKQVGALTAWSKVSVNGSPVAAIKTNGTLWAWGGNGGGQLGQGDVTNRSSPVQVGALTTWAIAAAGYNSIVAFKTP